MKYLLFFLCLIGIGLSLQAQNLNIVYTCWRN